MAAICTRAALEAVICTGAAQEVLPLELALDFPEEERMMQQSSVSISLSF